MNTKFLAVLTPSPAIYQHSWTHLLPSDNWQLYSCIHHWINLLITLISTIHLYPFSLTILIIVANTSWTSFPWCERCHKYGETKGCYYSHKIKKKTINNIVWTNPIKLTLTPIELLFIFFPLIFCAFYFSSSLNPPIPKVGAKMRQPMFFQN